MKIWIARDGEPSKKNDGELFCYDRKPMLRVVYFESFNYLQLDTEQFPEIKNGECFEAEITLGEKVGEK